MPLDQRKEFLISPNYILLYQGHIQFLRLFQDLDRHFVTNTIKAHHLRMLFNLFIHKLFGDFVVPNVLNNITEISLVRASIPQYGALETFPYEKMIL